MFLAVPDQYLAAVAAEVGEAEAFVHMSGAQPLAVLGEHPRRGSLHPYQSFPVVRDAGAFEGALFAVDATDAALLEQLAAVATQLKGFSRRVIDADRTLYHASAVLGANLLVALAHEAAEVLGGAGFSRPDALQALLPLMSGVLENLRREGLPDALIGPIRRGDAQTVARHLDALDAQHLPQAAGAYRMLGLSALELAIEAGLEAGPAQAIRMALTGTPAATEREVQSS